MDDFIFICFWLALAVFTIEYYFSLPTIYESYSTKKCVYIVDPKGEKLSCDTYDESKKYHHVWVE